MSNWNRSGGWASTAAVSAVQEIPKVMMTKRYIVIDTAQRNWVQQPNPYSNLLFSFGSQAPQYVSKPVTYNNATVPTYATDAAGAINKTPGLPNTSGWYYGGNFYPPYSPGQTNFPNCNLPTDTYYMQPSGSGFGTVDQASNVISLRVVRVILPQKQFLNVPLVPGNSDSSGIQSVIVGKPYSTFSTYPYLLLNIDTYYGDYYGANEPTRRTFSALTQKTRTQTDFSLDVGVQHYDYEPWGAESHALQAPIPSLQKLTLTLNDPVGFTFNQTDSLTVSLIQADPTGMYLRCFTGSYKYFNSNDLRIGDRVVFDPLTLSNIEVSPLTPSNKISFVKNVIGTPFLVVGLLDYVPNANGLYVPRSSVEGASRTLPYVAGYNGFLIPNFYIQDQDGNAQPMYPGAINGYGSANGNSNVLEPNSLVGSNMPFLNTSLQPVYTIELTCALPDTAQFGRNLV